MSIPMNRLFLVVNLVVLLLLGFRGNAFGQMVQYGKVVETNSKGKTLSGVSIRVLPPVHDCQPTSSDAHGAFRLCFSELQVGDTVLIRAEKNGYDVVNIHVINCWTLTDRKTLCIEMAPTDKINKERKRYYGIVEAACVARYDSTMHLLDVHYANHTISMHEYQYWKLAAEKEMRQSYQNMEFYADAFARINEDNTDATTQEILCKLKANDIEGAMALVSNEPYETVLQAYNGFTIAFPMEIPEVSVAGIDTITPPESDSLYQNIIVLQTYANLFEGDFSSSGLKYAKSCAYLGILYKEKGWDDASRKYLTKALRMYEMLDLIEGIEVQDKIDKVKQLLNN